MYEMVSCFAENSKEDFTLKKIYCHQTGQNDKLVIAHRQFYIFTRDSDDF